MSQIPEGYKEDATGALRRIESISEIDLLRDELVQSIVQRALQLHEKLVQLKAEALDEISAFIDLSAAEHGRKFGGKKGNVTLNSYDGKNRIQRKRHDFMRFDEGLLIAKEMINEIVKDWVGRPGVPKDLETVVENYFRTNDKGDIPVSQVLQIRKLPIADPRWKQAMDIITSSITVAETVTYLQIQKRVSNDRYENITLDLSGV